MRREPEVLEQQAADLELAEACILCGGTLSMRIAAGSAATYCRTCRWISRPAVRRHDDQVSLVHSVRLVA